MLEYAEPLDLVDEGNRIELSSGRDNIVVGRLSRNFVLPAGKIVAVTVDALVRRYQGQSDPEYAHLNKVPRWRVVLATIVIE